LRLTRSALGVDAWRPGVFELILVHMQMPVMDGLSAITDIRRLEVRAPGRARPPSPGRPTGRRGPASHQAHHARTPACGDQQGPRPQSRVC